MSGFAVAAVRCGLPDTGLVSYGEMLEQGRNICGAVSMPIIGDGDTGYGNAVNVKRTVRGYADAGFAAVMIEDQIWPKRCGHTRGKSVVSRGEAVARIQAAVDARDEIGFKLVAHPFAVFGASIFAMKEALRALREGRLPKDRVSFSELREDVGFEDYYREESRYRSDSDSS